MRTRAWLRFKQDIVQARKKNFRAPNPAPRVAAINAAPEDDNEVKHVAKRRTKKQKAATAKMIRANKRKRSGGKKRRRRGVRVRGTPFGVGAKAAAPKRRRRRRKAKAKAAAPKRRRRRSSKRRRRSSAKRRGSSRRVKTIKQRVVSVPKAGTQSVRIDLNPSRGGKKRRRKRRKNPETSLARASNPGAGAGLLSNAGPFTRDALMGYVAAAGGVGLGVIGADFLDRFIATRTPSEGTHPWYGRNASAAYNRRPDAMRLGAQAGGAVAAMALTYFARNMKVIPWLTGGLSVGFGVNLLKMMSDWYLMPAIFKVDSPSEVSFANRMFPMEQAGVQDEVDALFEAYSTIPSLAMGQPAVGDPTVMSPFGAPISVYQLGSPEGDVGRPSAPERRFIKTGKLGACGGCGGNGGCHSDCPNMCSECIANGGDGTGTYTVQPSDTNYPAIVQEAGVDAMVVAGLNGGQHWQQFWRPGAKVQVPYALGVHLQSVIKHRAALAGVPAQQAQPFTPVPPPVVVQPAPITNGNGEAPVPNASSFFNSDAE